MLPERCFVLLLGTIFVWLLCLQLKVEAKTDFELQVDNFTCSSQDTDLQMLKHYRCGMNKNTKRRSWHMEFQLQQPLAEYEVYISIVLPRRKPMPDFVLLNLTTDGCQLLCNRNQVPLLSLGRNIMKRFSNYPKQCPFQGDLIYYIRGFRMDLSLLPAVEMETPVHIEFGYQVKSQGLRWLQGNLAARVQRISEKKRPKIR
ncbi:uncharacterized protein LOC117592451 [Drosophila guanche]|uniref:Uncharacterized protein n=1 Tax=Drosophila guanche TaxID=7266 RepID=A0A3B0JEA3_DROGU|nr:uncharacterized protein LOC117592451 [Drosophila guanche]SPP73600.1 Hypothetical predicted protein [Drosophila guanche]